MNRVILDTDVSSLSLKRRLPAPALTRLIGKQPCITFVTFGELTQWAELRRWGRRNRDALDSWLDGVIILPYSEDVARTRGRISAAAIQRGRPRPANDTRIAACALTCVLPLATLNAKDFKNFAEARRVELNHPDALIERGYELCPARADRWTQKQSMSRACVERVTRIELALSAWEVCGAVALRPADSVTCGDLGGLSLSDRDYPRVLPLSGTQRARLDPRIKRRARSVSEPSEVV